jgi:hypothetical protein
MRISEHFTLSEFTSKDVESILPIQWFMIQHLCENILEPLRRFADCEFKITSGMREKEDVERLIKSGYRPSETSDHDYGRTVEVENPHKRAKFGPTYNYSVGAVDIVPKCGALELFNKLKPLFVQPDIIKLPLSCGGDIQIGQLILERNKSYWLHISNPPGLFHKEPILELIKRPHFLRSMDNGNSYEKVI